MILPVAFSAFSFAFSENKQKSTPRLCDEAPRGVFSPGSPVAFFRRVRSEGLVCAIVKARKARAGGRPDPAGRIRPFLSVAAVADKRQKRFIYPPVGVRYGKTPGGLFHAFLLSGVAKDPLDSGKQSRFVQFAFP